MTLPQSIVVAMAALLGAALLVFSQPPPRKPAVEYPPWETKIIAPREISPARYLQVPQREIDAAAADGWELVSVAPFVLLNEARGAERRETVTQTYPAYYFKRPRRDR